MKCLSQTFNRGTSSNMDLFRSRPTEELPGTPLAERMRPKKSLEVLGQKAVDNFLQQHRGQGVMPNLILWGPPGTGKTSFAMALGSELSLYFQNVNAIETGAKSLREFGQAAQTRRFEFNQRTLIFIDEIHRLNSAQQDVLLPFIEKGDFILIGATTENPSYSLNRALLSRSQLLVFERLAPEVLREIAEKTLHAQNLTLENLFVPDAQQFLTEFSDGDSRRMLLVLERALQAHFTKQSPLELTDIKDLAGASALGFDRAGDQHYDVISAFIKSIRGSDADAALYYLARMIQAGEDIHFIARRLVILASEDVGNADPRALSVAVAGAQAAELVGLPEAGINLAQVVTYLASAPKSNRSYMGYNKALEFVEKTGTQEIPLHLRSSKRIEMKKLGYGLDYQYPHSFPKGYVAQDYFPEGLRTQFYEPVDRGFEKQIREYQAWLRAKPATDIKE